jgi:hypothetical protein
LRLPQHEGPGPCIYIPQEEGGPVIPPGTGIHRMDTSTAIYMNYFIDNIVKTKHGWNKASLKKTDLLCVAPALKTILTVEYNGRSGVVVY